MKGNLGPVNRPIPANLAKDKPAVKNDEIKNPAREQFKKDKFKDLIKGVFLPKKIRQGVCSQIIFHAEINFFFT